MRDAKIVRVPDARKDPAFQDNPSVEALGVVAYLGVPVEAAPGRPVGALCAISKTPRDWTESDEETLVALAMGLSRTIELRLTLQHQQEVLDRLERLNERFGDLAENVPGAIFRYVLHPDGRDEVEYMSPGCLDIWEVSAEDIRDTPARLWEIIVPEDVPGMQASILRSAEQLSPWQHRWRVVTRSGKQKQLQGYGQPRALENGSVLWNSAIFDVTVEVEAQEKLREQDRMLAEALKQDIIGRLAGGVAHDFNNLLAIVMGNAELLLSNDREDEAATYLKEIVQAAQRGSDLTRSLLAFARKSDLRPVVIDVNSAIANMHNLIRRTLPENIDIETSLMAGLWRVKADPSELERALLNLTLNSRDGMPNGGKLTIETANVRISDDYIDERLEDIEPGRYVMLAVSDTGEGMPAEVLERVFEPFFTTKGTDKGTGLGLPTVQGFAKQSSGTVRVYSETGKGVSVKVYLKAVFDRPEVEPAKPKVALETSRARVLVVEDNEAVRRSVTRTLKAVGYSIIEAVSGDAALALFDDNGESIDVILTDVIMPGRYQGPDLVRQIRKRRPDIPVIFMSGYPHEANVHGNGMLENDVALTKPVRRTELLFALEKALRKA
jgi:signal transduction histidine kinase/ActR/RegA family two-component response regulator